jgi:molybdopterin synthase catalytic subunit
MDVDILLFAGLREALGGRTRVTLEPGATVADLRDRLAALHPDRAALLAVCRFAVGDDFVDDAASLEPGIEVAVIPPVSGGEGPPAVALVREPLDPGALGDAVVRVASGAVNVFVGTVRSPNAGAEVERLEYEAHETMALARMTAIVDETRAAHPGSVVLLHHRLGPVLPGEPSVVVAVSTPHRGESFDACRAVIERLKVEVPIWKKEITAGGGRWVGEPEAG